MQANSGATRLGGGGDVRVRGQMRVECKYTESCSYVLKLGELLKLRDQAIKALEEPVLQFEFRGASGAVYFKYAVVPAQGEGDVHLTRLTRQMSFHEIDLNVFFHREGHKIMRVAFVDKKKVPPREWRFDILEWDVFTERFGHA